MKVLNQQQGNDWTIYHADVCDALPGIPDSSIDYSVFSPPFASLYTYSPSDRDMGNSVTHEQFYKHFGFLMPEMWRVTKPGRCMSMHCMALPTLKYRDGEIGLWDFPGELVRAAQSAGWIFHSKVTVWKDPVIAMQRTKAIGLLWKQLKKDSCMSRMGIPDEVLTFRRPGVNTNPVSHEPQQFPVEMWQKYASPVWDDIDPSDTLQARSAREEADERHICPLQLEVIRRCLRLWSNPRDVVLSPFAGIGSEGYVALDMNRRFVGFELKESYFKQACKNLATIEPDAIGKQIGLFANATQTIQEEKGADDDDQP